MRRSSLQRAVPAARLGEHVPFIARGVAEAPASPGVYLLYRGHRLIYIGLAANGATIQERLRYHLRGDGGPCMHSATEFDYETSADPVSLYRHYVAVYVDATGGMLPDCNEAAQ
jgi:hypothetical protein